MITQNTLNGRLTELIFFSFVLVKLKANIYQKAILHLCPNAFKRGSQSEMISVSISVQFGDFPCFRETGLNNHTC